MKKATIGVVIPAYNEERVLESSVRSLLKVLPKRHVYIVSDGSTDATAKIAKRLVPNILALRKNRGKAEALQALILKYELTKRYQYIFFFDADTRLGPNFIKEVKKAIKSERPACIVGTVASDRNRLISAYRVYEYGFTQMFFKTAQNVMGTILIAPGCAAVYRTDVLAKLDFSQRTLTEDMDFTLQIHKKRLGRVAYCSRATVVTQDPETFGDYWKQISRWNTGFWQNIFLHRLYLPNSKVNFEAMVILGDFLLWLVILALAISEPLLLARMYGLALFISSLIGVATALVHRQFWALPYAPLFGLFHLINLVSFVHSFFRAILPSRTQLSWQKVSRYAPR